MTLLLLTFGPWKQAQPCAACSIPALEGQTPPSDSHLSCLPASWLGGDCGVKDLELDIPDGFITQRALSGAPLEALNNGLPDGIEQTLVRLSRESVVQQYVGPLRLWPKRPQTTNRQQVPVVLVVQPFLHRTGTGSRAGERGLAFQSN